MSDISHNDVVSATVDILKSAETVLPEDVVNSLKAAKQKESSAVAKAQLEAILKNIEIAGKSGIPMCQDTGILIFFVEIGREVRLDFDLEDAIIEGVRQATESIPLRPNAVHPLTRNNKGDNVGDGIPDIKYDFVEGGRIKIGRAHV